MNERDYVGPDFKVHYRRSNDSSLAARFLFSIGIAWAFGIVYAISQSVN